MIRFLLNQTPEIIEAIDPNTTVLNYLRQHKHLTGTKEGCASGDCGACTAVLVSLQDETLSYEAINTCLTLLPALEGKQLITIEALKQAQLHPVQKAMVEHHGSQCGFCTPGIVMSLFALQKNVATYQREDTLEALSGNLCRCTGYQPIINAAKQICDTPSNDIFDQQTGNTIAQLKALQNAHLSAIQAQGSECYSPRTLEELDKLLLQKPNARILAGGTDLALEITQLHHRLSPIVYLGRIEALKRINLSDSHIEIGAACTLSHCHSILSQEYPDLGKLLDRFASLQIRNQGTLGGNIANASPIGDSPPALIAAGASVQLRRNGHIRCMPLDEFFIDYRKTHLLPGEYIEKIIIPRKHPQSLYRIYKVSKRLDDDISAVCGAFHLQLHNGLITNVRIAFGGMAAIPKRAVKCERALAGQPWQFSVLEKAIPALNDDFNALSDFRASAQYRTLTARNLLMKLWWESQHDSNLITRVSDHVEI